MTSQTTRPPKRNRVARAVFFAQRGSIKEAIDRGEYLIDIHRSCGFPGSYVQFTRYVARYITAEQLRREARASPPAQLAARAPRAFTRATPKLEFDPSKLTRNEVI